MDDKNTMKKFAKHYQYGLVISSMFMLGCTNQNLKISSTVMPTTNACTKLNALKSGYFDDFSQLKGTKVSSRASDIWKAKYQLFGKNCQIFSWGGKQHTYSCNVVAPDEDTAKQYYENAKNITQQCLGASWQAEELQRKHNDGIKTVFTENNDQLKNKVTFSTHLVISPGVFSQSWTLFYYVGNMQQPK
jgi:hypothetical protein